MRMGCSEKERERGEDRGGRGMGRETATLTWKTFWGGVCLKADTGRPSAAATPKSPGRVMLCRAVPCMSHKEEEAGRCACLAQALTARMQSQPPTITPHLPAGPTWHPQINRHPIHLPSNRMKETAEQRDTRRSLTAQPRAVPDGAVHDDVADALGDLAALDDDGEGLGGELHLLVVVSMDGREGEVSAAGGLA